VCSGITAGKLRLVEPSVEREVMPIKECLKV